MRLNIVVTGILTVLASSCAHKQTAAPAVVTAAATASSAAKPEPPKIEFACKLGQEVRTLKMEALQPKGCKLFYSNHMNGADPIASSEVGNEHCERVRDRIRENLEKAGYKCGN